MQYIDPRFVAEEDLTIYDVFFSSYAPTDTGELDLKRNICYLPVANTFAAKQNHTLDHMHESARYGNRRVANVPNNPWDNNEDENYRSLPYLYISKFIANDENIVWAVELYRQIGLASTLYINVITNNNLQLAGNVALVVSISVKYVKHDQDNVTMIHTL